MAENGNGKAQWIQVLLSIIVALSLAIGGYAINRIDTIDKAKVDKEQYYQDIQKINQGIDQLIRMHIK